MKNEIAREVFSLPEMDVVKASYKNSVYYIAGSIDITEYVSTVKNYNSEFDEKTAIKYGLAKYLRDNPQNKGINVPLFDVVLLKDNVTTYDYMVGIMSDIFRKDDAMELAYQVTDYGSAVVGTYPFELAHTFSCMVETANRQCEENLMTDIVPSTKSTVSQMDSLEVLERLIRRDHPGDM